ncbi:hypothetical protein AMTRI_Chr11g95450 [Amborella trichopoda]|uniref:Late embryogenesis abundant protein LEA-2 subgroup domain-containing protein n=1 Tax=Amborella trichopoda TaxID=13333 RepID=U5D715_AMBTC|nr:NDR1/HIN1-like protein 12 [Amborella trichopoda]ERN16143.1 hypothetical protein AMTR_s00030p00212910 [Amborella trichopoda]|eukprot:XP_006854676.1 NDR1/HIN1-like protein 12 [Amborella trichopoda]
MSAKGDCGKHGWNGEKLYRRLFGCLIGFIILILFIILIIWLVLRPTKPRFSLQDATVNYFNVTTPNLLSSNFQITIVSQNPNDRIGIYYDRLEVYASYRSQQITFRTAIPPNYQGHNDYSVWSPFLTGDRVPIAPFLAADLSQEQNYGVAQVSVKMDGTVRWKVGAWTSGNYHIYVSCNAIVAFSQGAVNGKVSMQPGARCYTDV